MQEKWMDENVFDELVKYPIYKNPDLVSDIKGIRSSFGKGISCSTKNKEKEESLNINIKNHVADFTQNLALMDYKAFKEFILKQMYTLLPASVFCPQLRSFARSPGKLRIRFAHSSILVIVCNRTIVSYALWYRHEWF